jgi:long-chain acyl-CoA synthetase
VRVHRDKVPSLRAILVSSAPLSVTLAREFEDTTGIPLIQGWGLSEYTNFACCMSPRVTPEEHTELLFNWEVPSIGPELPGTEVTVVDESGRALREGERGELCIRGHSRMIGYLNDPENTQRTIVDGWLHSGDQGLYRLHRGKRIFFVTGRIKEIIIRGAEKYSPLAIERRILSGVPELEGRLVVLGFAHEGVGEEIGAYLETESLSDELRSRLESAVLAIPVEQRPKVIVHAAAPIPRTHTGKIQRRKLLPLFAEFKDVRGALRIVSR